MSKVARVRARWHGREQLPPSIWREQLRQLAKWMLIVWAILFYVALTAALMS